MRPVKLTNLLICAIAMFLFGATYVFFKEPTKAVLDHKDTDSVVRGLSGGVPAVSGGTSDESPGRARHEIHGDDDTDGDGDDNALILPFANRSMPRRLLEVPAYMRMLNASKEEGVDIDIAWGNPDYHDLDQQTVIVTGLSSFTEEAGVGLVTSAQIHMPFKKIIIYNLGIKSQTLAKLTPLCNVEVRKFDYTKYPAHVKILRNNAWKLIVITEVLEEFGSVFYAHPHVRFRAPINILFPYVKAMKGFIPSMADEFTTLQSTHPTMLRLMKVPQARLAGTVSGGPLVSGNMLLFVMNSTFFNAAVPQLRKCFLRAKCISPPGSMWRLPSAAGGGSDDTADPTNNKKNPSQNKKQRVHHFDLSALSLMMYKMYGENWAPGEDVRRMMKRLFVVQDERGDPLRELSWSFRCNPPKEEFDPARLLRHKKL